MLRNNPLPARLLPRLLYQLVPAVVVTAVGVVLLSNVARISDTVPVAAPIETAISTEAVFKIVPREVVPDAKAEGPRAVAPRSASPKPSAMNVPTPPRKPADDLRQVASAPAPLPIVPVAAEPQAASDNSVMGRLRSTGTAVARMPLQAAQTVTGWFAAATPPRPPAPVPQNFQAAM